MSQQFLLPDEPNFIFNGINALVDMDCVIETELPDVMPKKRYETYSVIGRNGEITETFDDYEAYDLTVKNISIPRSRLREIKRWLQGSGELITHNNPDKYLEVICNMNNEVLFENEWGIFYSFEVTFRCQPLKRKVNEQPNVLNQGSHEIYNHGDEPSLPIIEIVSTSGDVNLFVNDRLFTILNTKKGKLTIDSTFGKVVQEGYPLFTKGEWPYTNIGKNIIIVPKNVESMVFWTRSVYL